MKENRWLKMKRETETMKYDSGIRKNAKFAIFKDMQKYSVNQRK